MGIKENLSDIYEEKNDPWSSHSIIYNWLSHFDSKEKILDIGTATGLLGKKFGSCGFYLKGLEPEADWANIAKLYYDEFLCLTLNQAPDEFLAEQDIVVCADVIEHMPNPEEELRRLVKLQKPDTQFIISVPNIAHIWVRLNLLLGKFNYTDVGILDRTHLRFFTIETFLKFLKSVGLCPIETKYTSVPLGRVNPFFRKNPIGRFIHKISNVTANLFPGLFAYQIVTRAIAIDLN